jgi:hypothetical protein
MKKLVWHTTEEMEPDQSGHYLVCGQGGLLPRVAYFDRFCSGGDWYEVVSVNVARDILQELCQIMFGKELNEEFDEYHDDEQYEYVNDMLTCIIEGYDKKHFPLSDAEVFAMKTNIEAWCELPEYYTIGDDEEYVNNQEAIDITTAIEPVIRRYLMNRRHHAGPAPWLAEQS